MKDHPIPFRSEMVKAILEGRKTMTRRPLKWQPDEDAKITVLKGIAYIGDSTSGGLVTRVPCKYGIPGDLLWVKETWTCSKTDGLIPVPMYRADGELSHEDGSPIKWTPSLFMPRWASRITLEITNIRVERVQEITEEDAFKEGVIPLQMDQGDPRPCFEGLWDSINGKGAWKRNDWVWVIEFKSTQGAGDKKGKSCPKEV